MADDAGLTLVVGIHDPETGRPVLAQGFDLAARLGADVVVAHVEEMPLPTGIGVPVSGMAGPPTLPAESVAPTQPDRDAGSWIQSACDEVLRELGLDSVQYSYRYAMGDPGHALTEIAEEVDAYCVVVGSRGEGFWAAVGRMFRPSVSRSVLRERSIPVLVIPSAVESSPGDGA